jgi:hypothetical protein
MWQSNRSVLFQTKGTDLSFIREGDKIVSESLIDGNAVKDMDHAE